NVALDYQYGDLMINVAGPLTGDARMGVTVRADRETDVITSGLNGNGGLENFFSDNSSYNVFLSDDGEVRLGNPVTVTFNSDGGSDVAAQTVNAGEKAEKPEDPTKEGFAFKGWYQVTAANPETLADTTFDFDTAITEDITLKAVWEEAAFAYAASATASFDEKIRLNFYVEVPKELAQGAYAILTCGTDSVTVQLADTTHYSDAEKQGYKFSYILLAKQIEDAVNIRLYDADGNPLLFKNKAGTNDYTETGLDMTILRYVDYMITNGSDSMKKLAQAAKDYCYAAKLRFDGGEYTFSGAVSAVTAEQLSGYASVTEGTLPAGVTIDSITAMFESDNSFRLYLRMDESVNADSLTFALDDAARTISLQQRSDGKRYLTFTGVTSTKLQKAHTFIISDGSNTYQVTVSVLTYVRSVLNNSTSESMITLAKALYLYNQAALNHFGNN
ncbi:MAG: InlB B-repeat-containing protein, partial [Clostridia bacterium]|nr:InlB B-repeat-containing protein [Clostridia bacterium]